MGEETSGERGEGELKCSKIGGDAYRTTGDMISEVTVTATGGVHQMLYSSLIVLKMTLAFEKPRFLPSRQSTSCGQQDRWIERKRSRVEKKRRKKVALKENVVTYFNNTTQQYGY